MMTPTVAGGLQEKEDEEGSPGQNWETRFRYLQSALDEGRIGSVVLCIIIKKMFLWQLGRCFNATLLSLMHNLHVV